MTTDDMELVGQYAAHQTESAFATLVSRYTNLVYSTAWRLVGDHPLAEEITQAVFIILARKAGSLDKNTILPSWLYRTACFTAQSALKRESRRQRREQEAYMQSTLDDPQTNSAWQQISPLLEEAMLGLGQSDRDALVLRFFEERSLNEVGMALGASEEAAKKRVNRALEKLRRFFAKRGVVSTTAIIAGAISAHSVQAAPAALANSVTAVALAEGTAASGSTLTLIKGALKLMAWTKMKTAIVIGLGVMLAIGTGVMAVKSSGHVPSNVSSQAPPPMEMQIQWVVGKQYAMRIESLQTSETKLPDQPAPTKELANVTQDYTISVLKELDNGGRQLELGFTRLTLDVFQGDRKVMSIDSAQDSSDPQAILFHDLVGGHLQYLTDPAGKVEEVDGFEELAKRIAASGPQVQKEFQDMFNQDAFRQYGSFLDMMPNRVERAGKTWTVKGEMAGTAVSMDVNTKYTFKDREQHGGHECLRIESTGEISPGSALDTSATSPKIEKGSISGEAWFDPKLGMIEAMDVQINQTVKVMIGGKSATSQRKTKSHYTLINVTDLEK